jgi:hypothetical protein
LFTANRVSKSLKVSLSGFRNERAFCEALAAKIRDDVATALELPADRVGSRLGRKRAAESPSPPRRNAAGREPPLAVPGLAGSP